MNIDENEELLDKIRLYTDTHTKEELLESQILCDKEYSISSHLSVNHMHPYNCDYFCNTNNCRECKVLAYHQFKTDLYSNGDDIISCLNERKVDNKDAKIVYSSEINQFVSKFKKIKRKDLTIDYLGGAICDVARIKYANLSESEFNKQCVELDCKDCIEGCIGYINYIRKLKYHLPGIIIE